MGPGRGGFWVLEGVDIGDGVRQLVAEQPRLGGKKGIVGSGRGLWVLEGDCGYWKGILGKKRRKGRDLGGGLGSWKGIVGTGRGLWVKRGTKRRGLGSWKGIMGTGRGFWVLEGSSFGSWKGWILDPGRGGFWVLKGSGFGS